MTVVTRIKLCRDHYKWSQRETCKRASIAHSYLQRLEAGEIDEPGTAQIRKLAEVFGVPAEWLAFGAGKKPRWVKL